MISIVVPIFNEIDTLPSLLKRLQHWQRQGCEILLVDGNSTDESADMARSFGFEVLPCAKGRAKQMNMGANAATGNLLLFLHADTQLPANADTKILSLLQTTHCWGRFDVEISGSHYLLSVIAKMMNLRSRRTGIATGDQAIFVTKNVFEDVGGFPEQPLMEDIELSKQLLRYSSPLCLHDKVITSGRRWESQGVYRTVLLMWRLRWKYWRGTPAEALAKDYV